MGDLKQKILDALKQFSIKPVYESKEQVMVCGPEIRHTGMYEAVPVVTHHNGISDIVQFDSRELDKAAEYIVKLLEQE